MPSATKKITDSLFAPDLPCAAGLSAATGAIVPMPDASETINEVKNRAFDEIMSSSL